MRNGGNKKAVQTDDLVTSVTFQEKAWTRFFHNLHLKAMPSSFSLLTPLPPSSLLPSLPLTVLPTNSIRWRLWGPHSFAPLPCVCWHLLVVLPPVVHWHIHLRLLPCLRLLSHLCLVTHPSCWLVVAFHSASASPSCCASARRLDICQSSYLHLLSCLSCSAGCCIALRLNNPSCHNTSYRLFMTALGFVRCRSRCRIHPVRHLFPQIGSGTSLTITVFAVVAEHICCQRGAPPAIAVAARPLPGHGPEKGVSPSGWWAVGNTVGVGPKSQLCGQL